ncbi:hypothetical protein Cfor_03120, partial [Coptotermes formosanus]
MKAQVNDLPFPPLKDFITFLEGRRCALENLNPGNVNSNADSRSADGKGDKHMKHRRNTNTLICTAALKCPMCKSAHALYKCDKFCNLTLQDRRALNRREQMLKATEIEANSTRLEETSSPTEPKQGSYCSFKGQRASQVLLPTATIKVTDSRGTQQPCRVLLDGGSKSNYITEALAQRLQLKCRLNEMPNTGINNTCSASIHSMDIRFSSKDSKYSNVVTCLILPNLKGNMPSM